MLALQRATSQSALQRAGLGLLRTLIASDSQPAAGLLYSHQRAYNDAQPGSQSSDLSPDLAWTISDAIASTQPEYWPRLSQPKLPAPGLSQVTLDQKARTFSLQEAVQLLLVRLPSHQHNHSHQPVPNQCLCLTAALVCTQGKRRRFDEAIEVRYALGTDPRRGDQVGFLHTACNCWCVVRPHANLQQTCSTVTSRACSEKGGAQIGGAMPILAAALGSHHAHLQAVRGAAMLPHNTGRRTRLCVFAEGPDAEAARQAGAEVVGSDELIADIQVSARA